MYKGGKDVLQERILQTIEKTRHVDQRKLAQIAHVNESSISRYLNGHDDINFEGTLRIVKHLFIEDEREIMKAYIPTLKSKNARLALEYCVMNGLWELVEQIIELLSASTNPVDKECATMYKIILLRKEKLLTPMEQLDRIEVFKPKELEMQILRTIIRAYVYLELKERHAIFLHIDGTEKSINKLKSTFMRDSFTIRLGLIMSYICLEENDLIKSREYSTSILEQNFFDDVKSIAYHNLGVSYMFEDYQKALDYLNKALEFYIYRNQSSKIRNASLNLSFLKSYWNISYNYNLTLDNHTCFLNYIYYLIKKGETALAFEHINRIDLTELTEWNKAFYYYYKGLLTQDKTSFYYSVESFSKISDFFRIQLPINELEKLGENEVALRILSSRRLK